MAKNTVYAQLNQGAARIMFSVGLGIAAVIVGSILSVGLSMRLGPRLQGLPMPFLFALDLILRHLWSLVVLPVLVLAAARVVALRTWTTLIFSLGSGTLFLFSLSYLQRGFAGVWGSVGAFLSWLGMLVLSGLWIRWAVQRGAKRREVEEAKAVEAAKAKASEYDVFRADAEALADRQDTRDGGAGETPEGGDGQEPLEARSTDAEVPATTRVAPEMPTDAASRTTDAAPQAASPARQAGASVSTSGAASSTIEAGQEGVGPVSASDAASGAGPQGGEQVSASDAAPPTTKAGPQGGGLVSASDSAPATTEAGPQGGGLVSASDAAPPTTEAGPQGVAPGSVSDVALEAVQEGGGPVSASDVSPTTEVAPQAGESVSTTEIGPVDATKGSAEDASSAQGSSAETIEGPGKTAGG